MHLSRSGRVVFIAQWAAILVLPLFLVIGRGLLGAQLGWLTILGIVYGAILLPLLAIPPILTVCDREVRRAARTRRLYDVATFVLWGAWFLTGITVPDAGDSGELDTALMVWTSGLVGSDASAAISAVAGLIALVAYLAAIGFAIAGIVRARRTDSVSA